MRPLYGMIMKKWYSSCDDIPSMSRRESVMAGRMSARLREAARVFLVLALSFSLTMGETPTAAAAATRAEATQRAATQQQATTQQQAGQTEDQTDNANDLGEGAVELSNSTVTIDGVTLTRDELVQALPRIRKMSDRPRMTAMAASDYANILVKTAIEAGPGLVAVGVGVYMVFLKLNYTFCLSTITTSVEYPAYVLPKDSLRGIEREISVIFTTLGVVIDGIPMGLNWLTYELAQYVANNVGTILPEISLSVGDIDWEIEENRKNHIAKGTDGRHEEGWRKLNINPDPKDPTFWPRALALLQQAYQHGKEVAEEFQGDDIMILEYAYDLPGTGCRVWVKIYYWITADPSDSIVAKLSDGGVDILPPGGG